MTKLQAALLKLRNLQFSLLTGEDIDEIIEAAEGAVAKTDAAYRTGYHQGLRDAALSALDRELERTKQR